jgi:hypothetical protein
MNRDRIAAELPPDMIAWLHAHADADLWEAVGRTVGATVGARLLEHAGEGGWSHTYHGILLTDGSPAVRACAHVLGCRNRKWSALQVTRVVRQYFELFNAWKDLYGRLRRAA